MYDFASHVAAGEKLPSLAFVFKSFDATVIKHHTPVPECVKLAVGCGIYSVIRIFILLGHEDAPLISFSAGFCSQPLDDEALLIRL
jgi:hypothetical protein